MAMVGQAAKHPEKPRVMLRLRLFKPTSPNERTSAMAASMSREAKQLPTVLPIQQTPTGEPCLQFPITLKAASSDDIHKLARPKTGCKEVLNNMQQEAL